MLINSPLPSVYRQSSLLPQASTLRSQSLNASKKLSLLFSKRIYDLQINSLNSRPTQFLPEIEVGLYKPNKSAYTSYSFCVIKAIFFDLTIFICLLLMQVLQNFFIPLELYSIALLIEANILAFISELLLNLELKE